MVESLIGNCGYSEVETRLGSTTTAGRTAAPRCEWVKTCHTGCWLGDQWAILPIYFAETESALHESSNQTQSTESGNDLGASSRRSEVVGVGGGHVVLAALIVVVVIAAASGRRGRSAGAGLGAVVTIVLLIIAAANVGISDVEGTAKRIDVLLATFLALGIVGVLLNTLAEEGLADEGWQGGLVVLETGRRFIGGAQTLVAQIDLEFNC